MATRKKNSHCSYCGTAFTVEAWPRTCAGCAGVSYLNPLPVAVALVPIDGGLLCVRRDIEPMRGELALPGGFLEFGETWQEGCARELREETGLSLDPAEVTLFAAHSAEPGLLLLFGLFRGRLSNELPPFAANAEVSEMVVIPAARELAFPLHTRAAADYFGAVTASRTPPAGSGPPA